MSATAAAAPLVLFADTETTGLPKSYKAPVTDSANWPRMVQLAWLLHDAQGNQVQERSFIIKPEGYTIPDEVAKVHRITTERALAEGSPLAEVLDLFEADLASAGTIAGHNISFDTNIIGAERHRLGRQPFGRSFMIYCTMKSGSSLCRIPGQYGYKWPRLHELYRFLFNEELVDAHDALVDVRAAARCYWEMKRRETGVAEIKAAPTAGAAQGVPS